MGFTHYHSLASRPAPERWTTFTDGVRALLAHPAFDGQLAYEHDQPARSPQVDAHVVRFNGIGRDGYETFYLPNAAGGGFCKTAFEVTGRFRVAFDTAVCASLISAHVHLGAGVSSDGDWFSPGWMIARAVYAEVTGAAPVCPWRTKTCSGCGLDIKAEGHVWGGRSPCCPKCGGGSGYGVGGLIYCHACGVPFAMPPTDRSRCFWCSNRTSDVRLARGKQEAERALKLLRQIHRKPTLLKRGWALVNERPSKTSARATRHSTARRSGR